MALRPIRRSLQNKLVSLKDQHESRSSVFNITTRWLTELYGSEVTNRLKLDFDGENNCLVITLRSKTLAADVALNLFKLKEILSRGGVAPDRILIH